MNLVCENVLLLSGKCDIFKWAWIMGWGCCWEEEGRYKEIQEREKVVWTIILY